MRKVALLVVTSCGLAVVRFDLLAGLLPSHGALSSQAWHQRLKEASGTPGGKTNTEPMAHLVRHQLLPKREPQAR
jgi:hypothetical protein